MSEKTAEQKIEDAANVDNTQDMFAKKQKCNLCKEFKICTGETYNKRPLCESCCDKMKGIKE